MDSETKASKSGPLSGVKIIDFTRLLPGPLATMFLGDMGADVIKVEDPDNPDYVRNYEPHINGVSMFYLSLNRCKQSLAINYLSPTGKQIIYDLIKNADVVIEQYRPGTMNEWGLGYEMLSSINPKLIYVSITGYGQNSSKAQAAGHDINYMAVAGALGANKSEDGTPVIPGFQMADIAGGAYIAMNAVLAALYQREKTGKGEFVDVAMTDAVLPLNVLQFAQHQATKKNDWLELSGGLANYNIYKCHDGKHIALGSLEPKFWNKFCTRVGKPQWVEKAGKKGKDLTELKREMQELFASKTSEEWLLMFKEDDICFTLVNEISDLENDAYLNERNMFVENQHLQVGKYKTINQPLKFKQAQFSNNKNAPELGEDTVAILKEINYTDERIFELIKNKIIKIK